MVKTIKIIYLVFFINFSYVGVSLASQEFLETKAKELYLKPNLGEARFFWESFREKNQNTDGFWELIYGNLLNKYEQSGEAAGYLLQAAKFEKFEYYAYSYMVETLARSNKFDAAEDLGLRLTTGVPTGFKAYISLGIAYQLAGKYDESIKINLKSLKLAKYSIKERAQVFYQIGYSYYLKGEFEKAKNYASQSIIEMPIYQQENWVYELLQVE